jgi:uncharacterized protein (TIGR03435 family)
MRLMVRALLADRFQLTVEPRTRSLPVHVLSVAKGGVRLKEASSEPGPESAPLPNRLARRGAMDQFAALLTQLMSGPIYNGYTGRLESRDDAAVMVVDRTGLTATYDIQLDLTAATRDDFLSGVTAALTPLGLRLDQKRLDLEVLTVTRLQRPSAN